MEGQGRGRFRVRGGIYPSIDGTEARGVVEASVQGQRVLKAVGQIVNVKVILLLAIELWLIAHVCLPSFHRLGHALVC